MSITRSSNRPRSRDAAASTLVTDLAGPTALAPTLAASWERSVKHGLRRQDRALFNYSISNAAAKRVTGENRELLTHAGPEMLRLFKSLGSARWLVLCLNTSGQVVCFTGDRASAPRELQVLMQPGRLLLEAQIGTTAPGCVLEERRPIVVRRTEHFLTELNDFSCASAPIQGPDGKLIGVLDITGIDVRASPLAGDLVEFATRRIENSLLAALEDCTLLRLHCDERLLGTPLEGILAVDRAGVIRGANRTAGHLLGLHEDWGTATPRLDGVLEGGLDGLLRRMHASGGDAVRIETEAGVLSFGRAHLKQALALDHAAPAAAGGHLASAPKNEDNGDLITADTTLLAQYDKAVRIVGSGLSIILQGETGTGKEVFARALHRMIRPKGPFLAINCAAIPEGLIESELFGYADGAFTGGRKGGVAGKIEQAEGGVLLLDEIGDMPIILQSRLLRVLQARTVTRVGGSHEIPVDLAVICATHHDLEKLIAAGRFREDLYYRLNGYTLRLPPLRERGDLLALIEGLTLRWSRSNPATAGLSLNELIEPAAVECLATHSWPGNVRQLEQVIRVLLALRRADTPIAVSDLPEPIQGAPGGASPVTRAPALDAAQIDVIRRTLAAHGGNVSVAARALGVARGTLYQKLKRYGLKVQRRCGSEPQNCS